MKIDARSLEMGVAPQVAAGPHPIANAAPEQRTLPVPDTALIGRTAEIAALTSMVEVPGLVTVTGEGGVGKTRVVLEVARRQSRPVAFVPLADLDRTGATIAIRRVCAPLLLRRFDMAAGTLLDVPREPSAVGRMPEPRMLVLDSVEQVEQISDLITEIRGGVPELTILVTSRSRLGLSNERVLHVVGLPTDPDGPAVELFLARATAIGADPVALDGQRGAIARLCDALDGVPLAVELAAARTRLMSPTALLAQMHSTNHRRVLTLLAKGPADLPKRQLSMRATLAWSHRLLDPPNQILFRRLGIFPTNFGLEAAEAIVGDSDPSATTTVESEEVLDGIADMVDLHLIEPLPTPDPGRVRFVMSEVARAFAAELLAASPDAPAVRGRLIAWCLDLLGRAERGMASVDEGLWLDRIEQELPIIRQALHTSLLEGDVYSGLRLSVRLGRYWCLRGAPAEGLRWYRSFIEAAEAGPRPSDPPSAFDRAHGCAMGWWGRLAADTGDQSGLDRIRLARPASIDPHRAFEWLSWTDNLLLSLLTLGEYAECSSLVEEGLQAAENHHDPYWTCVFLLRRAIWRWMTVGCGDDRLAFDWARMAYVAATDSGLARLAARAAILTSLNLMSRRDWVGAGRMFTRSLAKLRTLGDGRGTVTALNGLGLTMIELDRPQEAARHLIEAIAESRRCDDRLGEATAAWGVSFLACRIGRQADVAVAVDAVAENLQLLARVLPAPLLADYRAALSAGWPDDAGAQGEPDIQGWVWLRGWAVGIASDIARQEATDADAAPQRATDRPTVNPKPAGPVLPAVAPAGVRGGTGSGRSGGGIAIAPADTGPPASIPNGSPSNGSGPNGTGLPGSGPNQRLTARELEILAAIASGRTNAQIATDFFLSTKTVMHHSVSIYRKLEVHGRAEAVALAYRTGLLAPAED